MTAHQRLKTSFPYFAAHALKIKPKFGGLIPFNFNMAQHYLHRELEIQRDEMGIVRALILKGRQQGCSTYVGGRFLHHALWHDMVSVYILSHERESTKNLFAMVKRYYENLPGVLKAPLETSNIRELKFENGSEYRVGTAGAKSTGRSQTNQLFHGSEVAYYDNADDLLAGVFQTVPTDTGSEIILESTANGKGNYFHTACMDALQGKGEYKLIFIPWYWQPEYRREVPTEFEFSDAELELKRLYQLDDAQLYWRHLKVQELKSERIFKQEYPFTAKEAFQSTGTSLIEGHLIDRARKSRLVDERAPVVLGVDPARGGDGRDRTVLIYRRGRQILHHEIYYEMEEMRLTGIIAKGIERFNVVKAFIDRAAGQGTVDRLRELGYGGIAEGIHFGQSPIDSRYMNLRAEMAGNVREWFLDGEVSIPDNDDWATDIAIIPDFLIKSNGLLYLTPKDKIKEEYKKSPDIFDSLALTFAFPVRNPELHNERLPRRTEFSKQGSPLKSVSRLKGRRNKPDETTHAMSNIWGKR